MAATILSNLIGYRKTALRRADDETTLSYAIDAIYQAGYNTGREDEKADARLERNTKC